MSDNEALPKQGEAAIALREICDALLALQAKLDHLGGCALAAIHLDHAINEINRLTGDLVKR